MQMRRAAKTISPRRLAVVRRDVGFALVAHDQGAVVIHPSVQALDLVAPFAGRVKLGFGAVAAAMFVPAFRNRGPDTSGSELAAQGHGVEGFVHRQHADALSRLVSRLRDTHGVQYRQGGLALVGTGRVHLHRHRNTAGLGHHHCGAAFTLVAPVAAVAPLLTWT